MSEHKSPLFLERQTYRRRRVTDAARLLPVLGGVLWAVPLLWGRGGEAATATSSAMLYIFGIWLGLVITAAVLARWLKEPGATKPDGH